MAHAIDNSKQKKRIDDHEEMEDAGSMDLMEPPPPDGGWGWVVVFASFMIHIVTDGVTYSFGVFYLEFIYYFEEGKGRTAWIASILVGVTLCSGPISSIFVNKYGCQAVTIVGAILSSACLLISVWAKNILTLYFTIGIGAGLGFGLIYLPAIVSVTCYFEKYRSLATGLAVCGSGLGTFIFAPFCEYLIATYGWRGAMMIMSGIVLNCIIFGALFRPIEPTKQKDILLKKISSKKEDIVELNESGENIERPHSVSNVSNTKFLRVNTQDDTASKMRGALSQPTLITKSGGHYKEMAAQSFGSGIMNRRDVFYQRSLDSIRNRFDSLTNSRENVNFRSSLRNVPNGTAKKVENFEFLPYIEETFSILHKMLEFSLLKDPVFILFAVSNFFTSIGFYIPYVYLLAQAQEQGIEKESSSYLLAIIGVANTIGRIVLGYVSDKPWTNRLLIYNLCLIVCGVSTAFSTFCTSFSAFAFYSVVFGFTAGAYVGLTSVILVDLLGLDHLTNAFGLLLLFQGLASLVGPPIAGWLYDAINSYDPGFYVAGGMIAISGLMLFFTSLIQRNVQRKADRSQRINTVL